jgi:tRNA G10  N-methylase Trm11
MPTYIYKLGHCSSLAQAEFAILSESDYEADNIWLHSSYQLNVNQTGSLVFGAEVIASVSQFDETEILSKISEHLEANPSKKIGLYLPRVNTKAIFTAVKPHCSKINLSTKLPNFGHWKQTNNWLVLIPFKERYIIARINSYSDQEFWNKLDSALPEADMRRGIINLKLARSLLNLTSQKNVWDSFAGQGRLLAAGMDLKDNFWASDLDTRVISQLNRNLSAASEYWKNTTLNKQTIENIAQVKEVWDQDATRISLSKFETDFAIVTEGTLGQNFEKPPTMDQAREQVFKVNKIWHELVDNYTDSSLQEIVGCLPFYPKLNFVPYYGFLDTPNWQLVELSRKYQTLLYNRPDSLVGHMIFKLIKK